MGYLCDQAVEVRSVGPHNHLVQSMQTDAPDDLLLFSRKPNPAPDPLDMNCSGLFWHDVPASLNLFHLLPTQRGDILSSAQAEERLHGGLDDVMRVRRAEGFGQNVLNSG